MDNYKMGLPTEFFGPNAVFLRKFRWIMESSICTAISDWFDKVEVDYLNKTIKFDVIDDKKGVVFYWLTELNKDRASPQELAIRMLDGCGKVICSLHFSRLDIKVHKQLFDYESSDLLRHHVELEYKFVKRKDELNIN